MCNKFYLHTVKFVYKLFGDIVPKSEKNIQEIIIYLRIKLYWKTKNLIV